MTSANKTSESETPGVYQMRLFKKSIALILVLVLSVSSQSMIISAYADGIFDGLNRYYLGDVNCDGRVTAVDARIILQNTAGLIELDEKEYYYGDCNEDDRVTAVDARIVLQITAGLVEAEYPYDTLFDEERQESLIKKMSSKVTYDELGTDLKWLVDDIGIRSWWDSTQNNAADEIYCKLISYGFTSKNCIKKVFKHDDVEGVNLVASVPTAVENPDILLFVAHYDTVRNVAGAIDNASGVVTLLQIAKTFVQAERDYGVELRFLFSAGEEQLFYGTRNYAMSLSQTDINRHKLVFNIDMSAKPNDDYSPGEKYYLVASTEPVSTELYEAPSFAVGNIGSQAVDITKNILGDLGEDGYYSAVKAGKTDAVPFRAIGIDSVTLSWRCIDPERSYGADYDFACPPNNHLPEDNMQYIDIQSLYDTTRLAVGSAAQLVFAYTEND